MEDLYIKLRKAAQKHSCLHHYTTIDALEAILRNRSIRLSRLDKVNDPVENQRIDSLWNNRIFVACFTHENKENEMFWNDYGKREKGVKITFNNIFNDIELYGDAECKRYKLLLIERAEPSHTKYNEVSDWGYKDISITDIEYVEELSNYTVSNDEIYDTYKDCININPQAFKQSLYEGLIKEIKWQQECETRIRVALKPKGFEYIKFEYIKPTFDYIYLRLDDRLLKNMNITLSPWSNNESYKRIMELLKYTCLINHIIVNK